MENNYTLSHCLKINKTGKKTIVTGNYGLMALLRGSIFANETSSKNIPQITRVKGDEWQMEYSL
jgi:hypothetical protein